MLLVELLTLDFQNGLGGGVTSFVIRHECDCAFIVLGDTIDDQNNAVHVSIAQHVKHYSICTMQMIVVQVNADLKMNTNVINKAQEWKSSCLTFGEGADKSRHSIVTMSPSFASMDFGFIQKVG